MTFLLIALTIGFCYYAVQDYVRHQQRKQRPVNPIAPIYAAAIEIMQHIEAAQTMGDLEDTRAEIQRFSLLYYSHGDYEDTMDDILDTYNVTSAKVRGVDLSSEFIEIPQ